MFTNLQYWAGNTQSATVELKTDIQLGSGIDLKILDPDVDNSGPVNITDILLVAARFGTYLGGPANDRGYTYDPIYDLDANGSMGIFDVLVVAGAFGLRWPPNPQEGNSLQFYIKGSGPEGSSLAFTATNLPTGASFTNPDGTAANYRRLFRWTPSFTQAGSYTVSFTVSTGGQSETKNLTITVRNTALMVSSVVSTPNPFRPSIGEKTTITARFNQPVRVWALAIKNSAGTIVRDFNYAGPPDVATFTQIWDGRTSTGEIAPPDTYTYYLSAISPPGTNGGTTTRTYPVTVQP